MKLFGLSMIAAAIAPALAPAEPIATVRWRAETSLPRDQLVVVFDGETVGLEATLYNYAQPVAVAAGATAAIYWQTNGMETAWWQAPATVTSNGVIYAEWRPEMATADSVHRFFLGISEAGGITYRAYGTIKQQHAPGSDPNVLPLPVPHIDFAQVVVTNAPWTTEARVAEMIAEIPLPPAPDLSAYLRKDGGRMTGVLGMANTSGIRIDDDGRSAVWIDAVDGITLMNSFGLYIYGGGSIGLWDGGALYLDNITLSPAEDEYGFDQLDINAYVAAKGVSVSDASETSVYGPFDISRKMGNGNWCSVELPTRSGILALLSDIPDPPAPTPTYAEPAPWSLSLAMLPSAGESSTYVQTNADSDVGEIVQHSATYQDAQLSVDIEDRPPPYSYGAPTGTWSIVSDVAGAASGIDQTGRLSSSRAASGAVTVQYDAGTNGTRMLNVWLSQTAHDRPTGRVSEIPGTFRHACQTNLLARFAAVDPDGPRSHYGLQYGGANTDHVELHDILDALSPYNDLGDALAAPTAINSDFFWPELADALRCESVGRSDHPNWWTYAPVLAVSPHFAVTAAHWNFAPTAKFCVSREGSGTFVTCRPAQRWVKPGTDLAVVQYRDAIPTNCIARLCSSNTLARLSPSLFSRAVGVTSSQHNTVHPFVINGGNTQEWLVTGYDAATNAIHYVHGGDSGHVYGIVTPRAQFVPFGCFHSAGGGPALWLDENIDWINARLATLGESVTEWTYDELIGD